MTRSRLYRNGVVEAENFPVHEISDHLADPDVYVWVDFCQPTGEDFATIGDELNLHALAVEDAVSERQRPKLDHYDSHLFLSAYAVDLDVTTGGIATTELNAFITTRALVTVRKDPGYDIDDVVARWDASSDLAGNGVSFLIWGLLDHIVDCQFDAVQALDAEIEALEDLLFDNIPHDAEVQRRSFQLRKSLVLLRRVVLPMREVTNSLMRRDLHVMTEPMTPYYQDVYDHVLRATEWTESLRDLVTTILETNLTIQGNRMNLIMKKVTSWAAIFAVPTAITGFYGQNLPYPGFSRAWGFWASSALIIGLSGALYHGFHRRDWL